LQRRFASIFLASRAPIREASATLGGVRWARRLGIGGGLALAAVACDDPAPNGSYTLRSCAACGVRGEPRCVPAGDSVPNPCLRTLATYDGSTDLAISIALSPIDDYVLSGANGEVRLLALTAAPPSFRLLDTYREQGGRTFVAWSPDGQFALSASTDIRLLGVDRDRGTLEQTAQPFTGHQGDIYSLAWTPDGTHALSVGEDGVARLLSVDVTAGALEEVASFDSGGGQTYDVSFSPDGAYAALANQDATTRIVAVDAERRELREVARLSADAWVTAVSWSPRGGELLVGTWLPCDTVELLGVDADRTTLTPTRRFSPHPSGVRIVRFGPDDAMAITAGHDDGIRLYAFSTPERRPYEVAAWDDGHGVHDVVFSPDGTRILVAASHADRTTLLDASGCGVPP
jgi:WD40 repeat protein